MATKYTFNFTDTTKQSFDVQSYTPNGLDIPSSDTLMANASSANTTLKLYGKGLKEYGEGVFQDMIYMLENFANSDRPFLAIEGQIWYENVGGELFIRNATGDGSNLTADWDAVILATGTSTMSGHLTLVSADPVDNYHAVPLTYLTTVLGDHAGNTELHINAIQNTFLDTLALTGSPLLTASDVNQLIGITSNVQTQIDDIISGNQTGLDGKLSLSGDVMGSPGDILFTGGEVLGLPDVPSINSAATSKKYVDDINTAIQVELDTKLSLSGGVMGSPADIFFTGGGQVLGLPDVPSINSAATSKKYVDDRFSAGDGGDGVLTGSNWLFGVTGSPIPVTDITQTTLELTVTYPNLSTSLFEIYGIARVGHTHDATDVTFDNTFNLAYPTNTQAAIEYTDSIKVSALNPIFSNNIEVLGTIIGNTATFGGTVTASTPLTDTDLTTKQYVDSLVGAATPDPAISAFRLFDILTADLTSPTTYTIQEHLASDDSISITINGVKQYLSTRGVADVKYAGSAISVTGVTPTGLDQDLNYEFDIVVDVDGGAPTTITITSGTNIATHGALINAINAELGGSPPSVAAQINITDTITERFTTTSQSGTSSIVISDPGGGDVYLFDAPTTDTIVDATFYSDPPILNAGSPPAVGTPGGSPPVARPDTIEIVGNVEADYPVGKPFAIRGSDDAIYGSYDGVYSVHVHGAAFGGVNTVIPIAIVDNSTLNVALLPAYTPQAGGSPFGSPVTPVPAPAPFGSTYISPIVGFDQLATPVDGLEGDYMETDASGNASIQNTLTSDVVFNYDILTLSKIESLIFS